jgi:DNA-binding response OmpR family regulator
MYQQRILICVPAPIISSGLSVQFLGWGFEQIEYVRDLKSAIDIVNNHPPALLVLDPDSPDTQLSFSLIQQVRKNRINIPVIFISRHAIQSLAWQDQLQWLEPYKWLSKPCHIEDLWQAVITLLPHTSSSSQQG